MLIVLTIESFGECLRRWMRQRGYTNAALAQLTHEKSGTTISRLLHDQCTAQRCAAFLEDLLTAAPDMTAEEAEQFRRAVTVSRFGKPQYRANQVFLELMTNREGLSPASAASRWDALAELIAPWLEDGPCEMICFGCFDARVLGTLGALLGQADAPLTINHYYAAELHADLIFLLEHTLLLLGDPRYQLFSIRSGPGLRASSIAMQDALILRRASGETRLILPASGEAPHAQDFAPDSDLFGFYQRALAADEALQHRYSSDFGRGSAADYLTLLETCLQYEVGRGMFHLKPDIGTEYMPVDVLEGNFREWVSAHPEYAPITTDLVELYRRRYRNIVASRRPQALVMCKRAMTDFARTGRTTDHPFCFRPFTPRERVAILDDLIRQAEKNPCLTPLMLRDPEAMPQHQLIAYEDLGLLICDTQTDYSLEGYSEIFLNSPLVAEQFRTFMLDVLGGGMTESPEDSLLFLRELTALAQGG